MINNQDIKGMHREALLFFIKHLLQENLKRNLLPIAEDELLKYINNSSISIDDSPYFCIIRFTSDGISYTYDKCVRMQVLRVPDDWKTRIDYSAPCCPAPVVFSLYFNNNVLYEFEYFVADSSDMRGQDLFTGNIIFE